MYVGDCAGVISYSSNKQSVITTSSMDAEIYVMSDSEYMGEMYSSIYYKYSALSQVWYITVIINLPSIR